ncbi:MAG: endo alpha-1,4 polygalactosaminidase [Verrucomicrobiota bacterium]
MKPLAPLLLCAAALPAAAAPFVQDSPAPAVPAEARLLVGEATVEDGQLVVTLRGDGTVQPTPWTHLFLDADLPGPALQHSSGAPAGRSLDYLIESGNAYRFAAPDNLTWNWSPVPDAVLHTASDDGTLTWRLSLDALGLAPGEAIRVFAASYSADYAGTLDTLPRDNRAWTATSSPAAAASTRTTDVRAAFKNIASYACYYGKGNLEALLRRDANIVQPATLDAAERATLRRAGKLLIAYISIGEDDTLRAGDGRGPGGYDSGYFDRDGDGQPDRNGIWNSYFANAAAPAWREHFLAKADAILRDTAADGLFLDTVETCLLYTESRPAMVSLIKELRARHPEKIIVINRAWDLLPALGDTVDGLMFESFTLSYDFGEKRYVRLRDSGLDFGLDVWNRLLKPAQAQHGLVVLALDYSDTPDSRAVAAALDRAATLGMIPCVATINLDTLHSPAHRPAPAPVWLRPRETAESRIHVIDTDRNGFPAGTRVSPDSNFADYTVAPVVDGRGLGAAREAIGWNARAWASREAPGEHALEFLLPAPVAARTLRVQWAWERGAWFPARSFRVELLSAGAAGAWRTVARFEGNASPDNVILLPADEFTGLRIIQTDGGGAPGRPDLMWVQQVLLQP